MKQLTVRRVSEELGRQLQALAKQRGTSVNSIILEILEDAVGLDRRRDRLKRYMVWDGEDLREFEAVLEAQRQIDRELWE